MNVYSPGKTVIDVTGVWGVDAVDTPTNTVALHVLHNVAGRWPGAQYQQQLPEVFDLDLKQFKQVLLVSAETYRIDEIESWIQQQGIKNYAVSLGTVPIQGWQDRAGWFYRSYWLPHFLKQNQPRTVLHDPSAYVFEALLGSRRRNRDFVMKQLSASGLLQRSIVTYRDGFPGAADLGPPEFEWPYVSPNLDPAWEVASTINNQISFSTPWEIYQHSRYSLVCESIEDWPNFFFTEKTMKVLWGQRVFVIWGTQHYLAKLHELGFETFGDIIDESYDAIPDREQRWQAAWNAAVQLSELDWNTVMTVTQQRRYRNQQRMISLEQQFLATAQQQISLIQTAE